MVNIQCYEAIGRAERIRKEKKEIKKLMKGVLRRCKICKDKPLRSMNKTGVCSNCQEHVRDWRSKIKEEGMKDDVR